MMMPLRAAPRILAFDTSTQRGSVALLEGQEVRAEFRLYSPQTHSTLLLDTIRLLLDRLQWTLNDVNLVAVGTGPGSFTGIRIGVATALGIAQMLDISIAGISGLEVLAYQARQFDGCIGVVLDAHRSQVFYAEYASNKGRIRQSQKSTLLDISDLERRFKNRHLYIVGDAGVCRIKGAGAASSAWPRLVSTDLFLAAGIGQLAFARKNRWRSGDFVLSEPMYIRPPDALRNKRRKR